ncbi:hypothetical protein EDB86DRAFT_2808911 [Lactarius hatsudake]|nr:hypothetical protein EDB86DRAFT_2808911 [Lactarius hatsudake]
MPAPVSSGRLPPNPIQTQLKSPGSDSRKDSLPSAGPGAYDTTVIPPSHEARTLVLCFDGTGDQFDADNSNIIQFFSMLKKDDKSQQLTYYQAGIGTYTIPEVATPFMAKVKRGIDMAIGSHLDAHVMGGYEFLMEHYHAEDKICIFGFSRGAYTARALAGMIHKVGLLPSGNHQQVPFAYKMFTRNDDIGWSQSTVFKKAFSVDVEIDFIGVWDTVCSVGLIPHTLPFTHSNTAVRYFRHAISLDEHRAKFKANHWHLRHEHDHKGTNLGEMPRSNHRHPHYHSSHHRRHHDRDHKKNGEEDPEDGQWETDVREVWFAGCHCDVGGGSVPNGTRNSLARIPLRWMIRECFRANTGIQFYRESFKEIGLDPETLINPNKLFAPRPPALTPSAAQVAQVQTSAHFAEPTDGTLVTDQVQASPTAATTFQTEEIEELADALSPTYDQLKLSKKWWLLEVIPMQHRVQDRRNCTWKYFWKMNLGAGRTVPEPIPENGEKIYVHRSVKIRMEAEGLKDGKYVPKAKFHGFDHEWVD